MSGHRKWSEIRREVRSKPGAEAEIARYKNEMLEEIRLAELRRARDFTQVRLAEAMGKTQPEVSRIERETDLYLSTLRSYVEAMGGELRLTAVFPDGEVAVRAFGDLDDARIDVAEGEAAPADEAPPLPPPTPRGVVMTAEERERAFHTARRVYGQVRKDR